MSGVLPLGGSQLGLTTTSFPTINAIPTAITSAPLLLPPPLPQHQHQQQQQAQQQEFYNQTMDRNMSASARTASRNETSRRRRKRQHAMNSMVGPGLFFLETGGGYFLRIHASGKVDGQRVRDGHGLFCKYHSRF